MTVAVPYSWLKQVSPAEMHRENLSPFGFPPPFPWEELSARFGETMQEKGLSISATAWHKLDADESLHGFGLTPRVFSIDVAPLPGNVWVVMAESELDRFISLLLTKEEDHASLLDEGYKSGFCEFIALEIFSVFRKLSYTKGLTPHLLPEMQIPSEAQWAQDLELSLPKASSFAARIIFSEDLRLGWREKFAERTVAGEISIPLAEKLSLTLHLEGGSVTITQQEWEGIHPGDFILLDRCSFDPSQEKGRVMLTLDRKPLYRAKIKDGKLKILEFPLYHEVESTMPTQNDADAEDFDSSIEETHPDDETDVSLHGEDSSFTDDESEILPEDDEESAEGSEASHEDSTEEAPGEESTAEEAPAAPTEPEKVNVGNLPLTIVIEIGRLQISVRKLLELQPGEILELDADAHDAVDLCVNGTVIGKGELLKIGEALGVRILDKV